MNNRRILLGALTLALALGLAGCKDKYQDREWPRFKDALVKGDKQVVADLLLKSPEFVKSTEDGYTPLHFAVKNMQKDIAELLIQKGADVNAKDKEGKTALAQALASGQQEIVEMLRLNGGKE